MSINYGPTIGKDSHCVLALDAYEPESYPGTGTTWYDMSGYQNHCAPSDPAYAPTFVVDDKKYWEFAGLPFHQNLRSLYDSPIDGYNMQCTVIAGFRMYNQIAARFAPVISCGTEGGGSTNRFSCLVYGYGAPNSDSLAMGTDIWAPSGRRANNVAGNVMSNNVDYIGAWVIPQWGATKTTTKLFQDGVELQSYSYGGSEVGVGPTTFRWHIGNWQITRDDMDWNGRIYFVYVYDYPMTNDEILKHSRYHAWKVGKTI